MSPELNKQSSPNNETPRSSGSSISGTAHPMATNSEQLTDYDKLISSRYQLVASGSAFADYDSFTDVVVRLYKDIAKS